MRDGEELVRLGLSEKTNFEVTLFRAVESGKSRSIDQVIRRISQVLPKGEEKKKPQLIENNHKENTLDSFSEITYETNKQVIHSEQDGFSKPTELAKKEETPLLVQEADISDNQSHELTAIETSPRESKRQVQDEAEINKRIEELPENLRKSLVEKFKVNFVSIEKIDQDQLI